MTRKTAYITIFGLDTPGTSSDHGLREFVESLRDGDIQQGGDSTTFFFEYDHVDLNQLQLAQWGFERTILIGHSFGGAAVKYYLDKGFSADMAIFFDPAPNPILFQQFFSWQDADRDPNKRWHVPSTAQRARCFIQRNGVVIPDVLGVCGVPFIGDDCIVVPDELPPLYPDSRVVNYNLTALKVGHSSMLGDPQVQAIARRDITRVP